MEQNAENTVMKRTVKDSVFTNLFRHPKYLLKLYKVLHPEDTKTTEADIRDVSIRNILTDTRYNDIGFRIGDRVLLLLEAQSTWSPNIIIRILMYLMQTYTDYCTELDLDLYSSRRVNLPEPELYVIYTGDRKNRPEYITLKDEFFGGKDVAVDARVRMIYDGQPGDIINQYVTFTKIVNDQVKKYGRTREALEEIFRICENEDVLREYLQERKVEVMDIMTALFDEEEVQGRYMRNKVREAKEEKSREIPINLLSLGTLTDEQIAQGTGLPLEEVMEIKTLHKL